MVLRIRFQKFGRRTSGVLKLVLAHHQSPAKGRFIERLATTRVTPEPAEMTKVVTLRAERIKYWLAKGAHPSKPAMRLLAKAGILPPPARAVAAFVGKARTEQGVDPRYERAEVRAGVIENVLKYRRMTEAADKEEREARLAAGGNYYHDDDEHWWLRNRQGNFIPVSDVPGHDLIMDVLESRKRIKRK